MPAMTGSGKDDSRHFRPLARDTRPGAEEVWIEGLRGMSLQEKARAIEALHRAAWAMALEGVKLRHPGAGEEEIRLRLGALRIPRELMIRAFGWDPEKEGW